MFWEKGAIVGRDRPSFTASGPDGPERLPRWLRIRSLSIDVHRVCEAVTEAETDLR